MSGAREMAVLCGEMNELGIGEKEAGSACVGIQMQWTRSTALNFSFHLIDGQGAGEH